MKNIVIFSICALSTLLINAQQTFVITNWQQGITQEDASFTIEPGDTVEWTWANGSPHSVTSDPGSTETFDSGVITQNGNVFSFTFTQEGSNPYGCVIHSSMEGIITVEPNLSIQEKFQRNVKLYPNPAADELIIASLFPMTHYAIYDVSGKRVSWGISDGTFTKLNIEHLTAGVYFVNVISENMQTTIQLIKD